LLLRTGIARDARAEHDSPPHRSERGREPVPDPQIGPHLRGEAIIARRHPILRHSIRSLSGALAVLLVAGCASSPRAVGAATAGTFTGEQGARTFGVFRPATPPRPGEARALVVMLHGCGQSAEDFARGTRMNETAARNGFVVLYPEQATAAHPQRCWNWYTPAQTRRGAGEAGLLSALIDSVARRERIGAGHIALVGMAAGAAMAANLAVAYPERYAALALHSGLPAGSATDLASATRAMLQGSTDGLALGNAALAMMGNRARPIPVIALHGSLDRVVSPTNLRAVVQQWRVVNARAPGSGAPVEERLLQGVGHAWSGGSADGSFTEPAGEDATALIVDFFRRVGLFRAEAQLPT
jgi:poly(hydroxyalkanoate) depolymerase family esterase